MSERVVAGLAKSRTQGRIGGRPTLDESIITKIRKRKSEGLSFCKIARELEVSRGTV